MRRWFALCLAALLAGCHRGTPAGPAPAMRYTEVGLEVENHYWGDVRIYVLHDGVAERIGMVSAASDASFVLPGRFFLSGGPIRLRAWPVASPTSFTSEAIQVLPDQLIVWTLETQLERSSVMLR